MIKSWNKNCKILFNYDKSKKKETKKHKKKE